MMVAFQKGTLLGPRFFIGQVLEGFQGFITILSSIETAHNCHHLQRFLLPPAPPAPPPPPALGGGGGGGASATMTAITISITLRNHDAIIMNECDLLKGLWSETLACMHGHPSCVLASASPTSIINHFSEDRSCSAVSYPLLLSSTSAHPVLYTSRRDFIVIMPLPCLSSSSSSSCAVIFQVSVLPFGPLFTNLAATFYVFQSGT